MSERREGLETRRDRRARGEKEEDVDDTDTKKGMNYGLASFQDGRAAILLERTPTDCRRRFLHLRLIFKLRT